MRLLIAILLFLSLNADAQIVRAHPLYQPPAVTQSCTYPLDTYTGAFAAYSASYKIRSAYAGSAIRIRRSNDNAEQDIGFSGCVIDEAAITSFVGSNSAYITTYYDQTGNGRNLTQTTAGNQPRIVNAGTIDKMNGYVSPYFDGSRPDGMVSSAFGGKSRIDAYFIQSTSDAVYLHFRPISNTSRYLYVAEDGSSSTSLYGTVGTPSMYINNSLFSGTTRNNVHDDLNGTKVVCIQNMDFSGWTSGLEIFNYPSFTFTGYFPIAIFYDTDQSANRSGIVGALNTLYSVY